MTSGQAPAAHFAHRPAPSHRAWGLAEQARRGLPQRVPAGPAQHPAHLSFLGVGPAQLVPSRSFELSKQTGSLMTTSGTCVPLVESAFKFIFVGGKVRSSACPPAPTSRERSAFASTQRAPRPTPTRNRSRNQTESDSCPAPCVTRDVFFDARVVSGRLPLHRASPFN